MKRTVRIGGRVASVLFFGLFLGLSGLFVAVVLRAIHVDFAIRGWPVADGIVERSEIVPGPDDDAAWATTVAYRYRVDGVEYTGSAIRPEYRGGRDYGDAEAIALRYPQGAAIGVRYAPESPARAFLEGRSPWRVSLLAIPAVFAAIGIVGLVATFRARRSKRSRATESISMTAPGERRRGIATAALVALVIGGGIGTWFLSVRPVAGVVAASGWDETACRVLSSRVRTHRGSEDTTYSVDVLYAYTVDEREYRTNRYDFLGGSSSGYAGKQAVVARYPVGSRATCFVDPSDPALAVLDRSLRAKYLLGAIPAALAIGGMLGLSRSLRSRRPAPRRGHGEPWNATPMGPAPTTPRRGPRPVRSGEFVLEPDAAPLPRAVLLGIVAIAWNAFVAFGVWNSGARGGGWFGGFAALFFAPFVLVGLGLIAFAIHRALAIANPRARIVVSASRIEPGATVQLRWELRGRVRRLTRLRFAFEGREEATYRRGTDSVTARETFATIDIADTSRVETFAQGEADFLIPPDTMHTFEAPNNKITWRLRVRGTIPRWPDLDATYTVQVAPHLESPEEAA